MDIKNVIDLIKEVISIAKKYQNFELQQNLCDIQQKIYEMQEENMALKQKLEIQKNIIYDEDGQTFTLKDSPDLHYCSICYGRSNKLIPTMKNIHENQLNKYVCRICEEIWHGKEQR